MKKGFLTPSSLNGKREKPADTPADKIGPDAVSGSENVKAEPSPRPAPPLPPQQPQVIRISTHSVTVQWQLADSEIQSDADLRRRADGAKRVDSPSRPGKEPAGGQEMAEINEGGEGTDDKEDTSPSVPNLRSSLVLVTTDKSKKVHDEKEDDRKVGDATGENAVEGTWSINLFEGTGGFEATMTGLEPGCSYSLLARLHHSGDHGNLDSGAISFSAAPAEPAKPDQPVVSGKGKNFVKLRWNAPEGRGAAVAQYEVEIRDSSHQRQLSPNSSPTHGTHGGSHGGSRSPASQPEVGEMEVETWGCGVQVHQGPETRCEIKGLRPGTSVQARVRAFNSIGASVPSPWVTVSTSASVPGAPPSPFVGQANIGNLFFAWYENEDNGGAAVTNFCLEVDEGNGDGFMVKFNGPDHQWLLSNTICGHPYKVRVKATNSVGSSPFSEVLEVQGMCGPPNPPGPPELMEIPPGTPTAGPSYSLCLRWPKPSSDNGSHIQLYQVVMRRIVDGVPVEFFQVVYAGPDTWCQVQGLFPASFYEFGLVAVSLLGTSAPSLTAILSTAGAPPGPPPPPFLLGVDGAKIHVGWTLPDMCNGSPVSSFVLESLVPDENAIDEATGQTQPGCAWVSCVQYNGGGISHWIEGLKAGIAVWLRVAGINAHGQGAFSAPANVLTPCAAPDKVTDVLAFATGPGKGCVTWQPPAKNGGRPIITYKISVGRKGAGGSDPIQVTVEGAGPAVVEGLVAGALYQAKVQAVNCVGAGDYSDPFIFSSEAGSPSAPKMPVVSQVDTDSIGISWENPAHDNGAAVEDFVLEMQETSATIGMEATGAAKNVWRVIYKGSFLSFQVGGLEPGGLYRFRVRGRNAAGDGPFSPPVLASTEAVPPGPPLAVCVLGVSPKELKLKWSAPAFSGGSDITSYAVILQLGPEVEREVWRGAPTSCKLKVAADSIYAVSVIAYTIVGAGIPSIPMTVTTPVAAAVAVKSRVPPGMAPPTVSVKGQAVNVSWTQCRDSQPPVVLYHVSAEPDQVSANGREDPDLDDAAHAARICFSGAATSTEVRDLMPGVNYRLRICAENEIGKGPWSSVAMCFQKAVGEKKALRSGPPAPAPPVKLVLEKANRTSVRIAWQAASCDNSSSAPGAKASRRSAALENGKETYTVQVSEGDGQREVLTQDVVDTHFVLTKLRAGTRYHVRVQGNSKKRGASGWSDELIVNTLSQGANSQQVYIGYVFMLLFVMLLYFILFVIE